MHVSDSVQPLYAN